MLRENSFELSYFDSFIQFPIQNNPVRGESTITGCSERVSRVH